jgi:amidohydrolase
MKLIDEIKNKAASLEDMLVEMRRTIHRYPEPAYEEHRTSSLVKASLENAGIECQSGFGVTGMVATIQGTGPGKTILLRADMDCLKLDEKTSLPFCSERPGLMHACGHDAHTAWTVGAAILLKSMCDKFNGTVKIVFQPAEEIVAGANRMIREGILEGYFCDCCVATHIDTGSTCPVGSIGIRYGAMCASPDVFDITVYGASGHCATPHQCIDPIPAGIQIYQAIQNIVTRETDPLEPLIISVGKIETGSVNNLVPAKLNMVGTVRALGPITREHVHQTIQRIVEGVAKTTGTKIELNYDFGPPPMVNDDAVTRFFHERGEEYFGNGNVHEIPRPDMTAEDFSYFLERIPGTYINIGTYDPVIGADKPLHNNQMMLNESIIAKTAGFLAYSVIEYLK